MRTRHDRTQVAASALLEQMRVLNLPFMLKNHQSLAATAADKHWSHLDYLTELIGAEAAARADRRVQRFVKQAHF